VDAAKARIESLNPLVIVETHSEEGLLEGEALDKTLETADLVCVTDWDRDELVSLFCCCC
jgi:ubiquitin-like 1-activating enzyme E1 A